MSSSIPKLHLTQVEQELAQLLTDVAQYINPAQPSQLRFTGGWVRDKLLGVGSHDIDVAINDMTGYQFGLRMKEYLEIPGNAGKHGVKSHTDAKATDARHVVRDLHKIEANPEKSKHLETVTTKIFGLDIDLVNLRKETYSDDSRNPQMEFGTPVEDALRRDATINAMFYNLQTAQVEDLTERGWDDMQHKIIRTPLDPYQTFKDDPLRVLRLIRFASRLDYTLDPASETSMQDSSIKDALKKKISRERVGVEIDKMLRGPHPQLALQLLHKMGLYDTVFSDPDNAGSFQPAVNQWPLAFDAADAIISDKSMPLLFHNEPDQTYLVRMLSAAIPYYDAPITAPSKKKSPIQVEIYRNGLKAPTKLCDVVLKSVQNATAIIKAKSDCLSHQASADNGTAAGRDTLGMLIREWGATWKSQCAFATMLECVQSQRAQKDILADYTKFLSHIASLEIEDAHALKPVIDGKQLAAAFDTKPGPWMKQALEEVMAWQLAQGSSATAEAATAELKERGWPNPPQGELAPRLVRAILRLIVRPLFAQSSPDSRVTAAGRAVMPSSVPQSARVSKGIETFQDTEARRPWKAAAEAPTLDLLDWAVARLEGRPRLVEECWPLLVPPILNMVDDVDVPFKARGCRLLRNLLTAVEPAFLKRTGLGGEFERAVKPCLSYLPSLTPQDDAILILEEAYPAMITLIRRRAGSLVEQKNAFSTQELELSNLLHDHLLPAYTYVTADEYPKLTGCLLHQVAMMSRAFGEASIAHLQYLIPTIVTVLRTPFAGAAPQMIEAATLAMSIVVEEAWARMWRWRGEIVAGLCEAHLSLSDASASDVVVQNNAKTSLKKCLTKLREAIKRIEVEKPEAEDDDGVQVSIGAFEKELTALIDADSSLRELVVAL